MIYKLLFTIILVCCSLTAQTTLISSLKDPSVQCDYLVITPQQFSAEAQLLVQHRNSYIRDSVNYAKIALLEDILSEFKDPDRTKSLQQGISWATSNWKNPSLKYIVLIGDDSAAFDAKDSVFFSAGRMPSWIRTSTYYPANEVKIFSSELQSDHYFIQNSLDIVYPYELIPNVSIGRIPCESKEQLITYISKVISYDTTLINDSWRNRVLLLADDNMQNKYADPIIPPFQVTSDTFGSYLRGYQIKKIYLSGFKPDVSFIHADARRALIKELNSNYFLTIFNGHGAFDVLTDENVLTSDYCDSISNTRSGIFLSFCCEGAVFNKPIESSIVKKMLFKQGGFVCIVGSTSLAYASQGTILGESFFSTFANNNNVTIGKCLFADKKTDDNYTLLGDPAILLKGNSINSAVSFNNNQLEITSASIIPIHYYYSTSKPAHVIAFPNGSDFDYDSIVFSDSGTFLKEVECNYPAQPDTGYSITLYLWDDMGKERHYFFEPENPNSVVRTSLKRVSTNVLISFDKKNIIIKQTLTGNGPFTFTLHDIQGRTVLSRSGTLSNCSMVIPFDTGTLGNKYYIWKFKTDNTFSTGRLVLKK
ncbi:MAG: hypothetical protein GX639_18525 [Fibrobacter sp.]|nr:hypothetical protein [Fibrobacter sp.]